MHGRETVDPAEASRKLSSLIQHVRNGEARVVVEEQGVPVAAIVSASDLARLDRLDAEREADFRVIDRLRDAFRNVPDEEIERETDRVLAMVSRDETAAIQ